MVSLDIYQITNYSSFSEEHIIYLIFKRFGFLWIPKYDCVKPGFISKSDYLKYQCFGSTGLEDGKVFIQTDLFPIVITNFQVLNNWKAFLYSIFQKFSDYNAQMFKAQVYSYTYSCKDRVLIRFGTVLVFLARRGSDCPNKGTFLSKERALVRFGLS